MLQKSLDSGTVVQFIERGTTQVAIDEVTGSAAGDALLASDVAGLGIFAGCVGKSASSRSTSGCRTPWPVQPRSPP